MHAYIPVPEWLFDEEPESPRCPQCGGCGNFIGALGMLDWFCCRACGLEFSTNSTPEEE